MSDILAIWVRLTEWGGVHFAAFILTLVLGLTVWASVLVVGYAVLVPYRRWHGRHTQARLERIMRASHPPAAPGLASTRRRVQ